MIEVQDLAYYETRIQASFDEIGHALHMIRSCELYRQAGYDTFDKYVLDRWKKSGSWARQLIMAERVQANLLTTGIRVDNARHARELVQFAGDLHGVIVKAAYAYAQTQGRPPTTRDIKSVGVIISDFVTTGHVDVGDGEMSAFDAAITGEVYESVMRQKNYIANGRPEGYRLTAQSDADGRVTIQLPSCMAGKSVSIHVNYARE